MLEFPMLTECIMLGTLLCSIGYNLPPLDIFDATESLLAVFCRIDLGSSLAVDFYVGLREILILGEEICLLFSFFLLGEYFELRPLEAWKKGKAEVLFWKSSFENLLVSLLIMLGRLTSKLFLEVLLLRFVPLDLLLLLLEDEESSENFSLTITSWDELDLSTPPKYICF